MKRFKFNYTQAGAYTFVLVPIILKNPDTGKQVGYVPQVDSGAVFNIFHTEVAIALGINLDSIKNQILFRGVGKAGRDFVGKPYVLDLMVVQKGISHKFESVVVFSDDIDKDGNPLLGMSGFFDKFDKITFDNNTKKIVLEA